jgi:hypothetical protein
MEVLSDDLRKLFINVGVHVEVLLVDFVRCVNIVSSAITESPVPLNTINGDISWGCIGENASDFMLLGEKTEMALNREVLMICAQPRKEVDGRVRSTSLFLDGLIWKIDVKSHLTVVHMTPVLHSFQ